MTFDIEAAKRRCEAATEGPWAECRQWPRSDGPVFVATDEEASAMGLPMIAQLNTEGDGGCNERDCRNAAFIAYARTDLPAAIARIEELESTLLATLRIEGLSVACRMAIRDALSQPEGKEADGGHASS